LALGSRQSDAGPNDLYAARQRLERMAPEPSLGPTTRPLHRPFDPWGRLDHRRSVSRSGQGSRGVLWDRASQYGSPHAGSPSYCDASGGFPIDRCSGRGRRATALTISTQNGTGCRGGRCSGPQALPRDLRRPFGPWDVRITGVVWRGRGVQPESGYGAGRAEGCTTSSHYGVTGSMR